MAAALSLAVTLVVIVFDSSTGDHSIVPLMPAAVAAAAALVLARVLHTTRSLRLVETGLVAALIWFIAARGYMTIGAAQDAAVARGACTGAILSAVLLLGGYAMLIPSTMRRAGLTLATITAGSVAMLLVAPTNAATALSTREIATGIAVLVFATGMALIGVAFITRFRDLFIGEKDMGMYDLKRRIAQGGMGEVWLAEHQRLARPAAIKLIREDMLESKSAAQTERLVRRFEREAKATAKLRSAHTVDVYDFGVSKSGIFYYVMEYLRGIDLEELVVRFGPLAPARTTFLLMQACEALQEAHDQGLVHRDVKPANIQCTHMGVRYDFIKVLDYGLVKPVDEPMDPSQITLEGVAQGTPAFMPPEMARGNDKIDARTDIYSLGCVGYWLLTGTLVFEAKTAIQMIVQHATDAPESPSSRLGEELPADIEAVIMRCLAKAPKDRYESANELAAALAGCASATGWDNARARDWWNDNNVLA